MVVATASAAAIVATGGAALAPATALTEVTVTSAATAGAATAGAGTGAAASAASAFVALGPAGWLLLGADGNAADGVTYDCWKAVVHDESTTPSKGRLLAEVLADERVKSYEIAERSSGGFPAITIRNIWDECFHVAYVQLVGKDGAVSIAAHAVKHLGCKASSCITCC